MHVAVKEEVEAALRAHANTISPEVKARDERVKKEVSVYESNTHTHAHTLTKTLALDITLGGRG